nr:TetR/AcrR family transcriptional regulator [uncultured Actinoplanes sp.]
MSSSSDLTARARIRDAAIELMAERGIGGATIRDIAQAAGVSSGLVRHHFGSKEGLRAACDEYVMNVFTGIGQRFADSMMVDGVTPELLRLQRYIVQSMMDESPAASTLFDRMMEYGEQWLAGTDLKVRDPRAVIAVIGVMKLSMYTMSDQLSRVLGEDVRTPRGWTRVLQASLEIFSHPVITPEQADRAREALERFLSPEE